MTEIDLGYKAPDYGSAIEAAPASPREMPTKTCYPEFAVPGNAALAKSLDAGQEITATVKLYVSGITMHDRAKKSEYTDPYGGTRVEFEVRSMTIDGVKVDETTEEDGKEAIKKFFNKKKKDDDETGDED